MNQIAAFTILALASVAHAEEHGDILLLSPPDSTTFVTGAYDFDEGSVIDADARVFRAEFDGLGTTDEPGFAAPSGSLPTSMLVGFDIADAVRVWDGADFDAVAPSTITCERFTSFATSPAGIGQTTPGFWIDTTGTTGGLHAHMDYYLDAPASDGIYLLSLAVRTNHPTIANPHPIFIVFDMSNPGGSAQVDAAIAYVESVIAPPACPGDITGDGLVNTADFNIFAGNFGTSVPPNTSGDLTGDGIVNTADFNILAGNFGCGG